MIGGRACEALEWDPSDMDIYTANSTCNEADTSSVRSVTKS